MFPPIKIDGCQSRPASPVRGPVLRAGDVVQVRSHDEIQATLDSSGALDGLPFMPEMIRFCGEQHRVIKVAHKTCDEHQLRYLSDTLHLEGLRCDGHDHGGCGNACLLYWKTAWLRKLNGASFPANTEPVFFRDAPIDFQVEGLNFICQATELAKAPALSKWQVGQYWRDLCSGNVGTKDIFHAIRQVLSLLTLPHGTSKKGMPIDHLELGPGELVEVKAKSEIIKTLDANNTNHGLQFVPEMFQYCGRQFRVLRCLRVRIDPDTGKLMKLKNSCVLLEGVTCRGGHVFCPRANYLFWREAWLRRIPLK